MPLKERRPQGKKALYQVRFEPRSEDESEHQRRGGTAPALEDDGKDAEEHALHRTGKTFSADVGAGEAEQEYAGPEEAERHLGQPCPESGKAEPEDDDLDDDFDEEPEEKPAKAKAPAKKAEPAKAEKKAGKCPCGHKWGIDCDADHCADDCIECDLWDACSDAQEEMNS